MANREKQDMTAELAEGKILPLVFKLTIPAVIAQLITFLYNICILYTSAADDEQ